MVQELTNALNIKRSLKARLRAATAIKNIHVKESGREVIEASEGMASTKPAKNNHQS